MNYSTFFILSFLGWRVSGAAELVVTPPGVVHVKALGESIVFTCTVTGVSQDLDPQLKWYDVYNQEITEIGSSRVYVQREGNLFLKLYITDIIKNDAGSYSCHGLVDGSYEQAEVELQLFMDIVFENAPTPQHPRIHDDALIQCEVNGQPKPTVSYRYKNQLIQNGGRYTYEQFGLRINRITQEDDGTYTCQAEVASTGNVKKTLIDVIVHIPPEITAGPENHEGVELRELTIECVATGLPFPSFEWYKDQNEHEVSSDSRIEVDKVAGRINFRPLLKEDEGMYTCIAMNDVGQDKRQGFVKVIVPPDIASYENVTGTEGQSQSLLCVALGDPVPQLSFRKLGASHDYVEGDNEGGRVVVRSVGDGELQLTINNLTPKDSSNYTCKASNIGGVDYQNGVIIVRYSARFPADQPKLYYNWVGVKKNLTCTALGEPLPWVDWYRDHWKFTEAHNNETFKIIREGEGYGKAVLQVTIKEEDQGSIYGIYRCHAWNELGDESIDIEMRRAYPPAEPSQVAVKEESPTMVIFTVSPPSDDGGVPVFAYQVEYDNKIDLYSPGEDILTEDLRPSTAYIFHFRAKNAVGVGVPKEYSLTTQDISKPYPLELISNPYGLYPYSYTVQWAKPKTGGLPIQEYQFKLRRVKVFDGTLQVQEPLEEWTIRYKSDNPEMPMYFYELANLHPETHYELQVTARNDIGWSALHPQFVFLTAKGAGAVGSSACKMENSLPVLFIFTTALIWTTATTLHQTY